MSFWEGLPAPTVLLVPVAVGLAVLIGVASGPRAVRHRSSGGRAASAGPSPAGTRGALIA